MVVGSIGLVLLWVLIIDFSCFVVNLCVYLFFGVCYVCEFYDLFMLWQIVVYNLWLLVLLVLEYNGDLVWVVDYFDVLVLCGLYVCQIG